MSYNFIARALPFKLHRERIRHELIAAGVTSYGLIKAESRYLPRIINENEHIAAVIYGQHHSSSAMLLATDQRVIYLDKKPMTVHEDEINYAVVSGVQHTVHIFFATVILHTAVTNYELRFVNLKCAGRFADYIEERIVEAKNDKKTEEPQTVVENMQKSQPSPAELKKFESDNLYWMAQPDDDDL